MDWLCYPPEILLKILDKAKWNLSVRPLNIWTYSVFRQYCPGKTVQIHQQDVLTQFRQLGEYLDFVKIQILLFLPDSLDKIVSINYACNLIFNNVLIGLANKLSTNTTLTSLEIHTCNVSDASVSVLVEALETNTTLTYLFLANNGIGIVSTSSIANLLKKNTTLKSLNLQDNTIGDAGALMLAEALQTNTTLTHLNLMYTGIHDTGCAALMPFKQRFRW